MLITLVYLLVALMVALLVGGAVFLFSHMRGERPSDLDVPPHAGPKSHSDEDERAG